MEMENDFEGEMFDVPKGEEKDQDDKVCVVAVARSTFALSASLDCRVNVKHFHVHTAGVVFSMYASMTGGLQFRYFHGCFGHHAPADALNGSYLPNSTRGSGSSLAVLFFGSKSFRS